MNFLLDTNNVSAHLRRPRGLVHRFVQHSGRLLISTISLAELHVWVQQSSDSKTRVQAIEQMLQYEVAVLPFDESSAQTFGKLKRTLRAQGVTVNAFDLLIASAAVTHNLTLVTNNVRHFENIDGLQIEDWLSP